MSKMIISLVINVAYSLLVSVSRESSILLLALLVLCVIQLVGILLLRSEENRKMGKIMYVIGIVGFVPLGLIGVFGMRSFLEENPIETNAITVY